MQTVLEAVKAYVSPLNFYKPTSELFELLWASKENLNSTYQ